MSDSDSIISGIPASQFEWKDDITIGGITAQEISDMLMTNMASVPSTINIPSTSTITITGGAVGSTLNSSGVYTTATIGAAGAPFVDPWSEVADRLDKLEKIISEEEQIRKTHPAVQTAYDHYRLLLVLAGKISPEDLTEK